MQLFSYSNSQLYAEGSDHYIRERVHKTVNKIKEMNFLEGDTIVAQNRAFLDSVRREQLKDSLLADSLRRLLLQNNADSSNNLMMQNTLDDLAGDSGKIVVPRIRHGFLEDVLKSKNTDSMIFNMDSNYMYLYKNVTLDYTINNLTGAYMTINLNNNQINAYGEMDDSGKYVKPTFTEKGEGYDMDSLAFNLKTNKAKIKGGYRQEGEGYIHGEEIKLVDKNTINMRNARYTTCDCEEPHFFIESTKSQLLSGGNKKIIVSGPSFLHVEGVKIPVPVPFLVFPLLSNQNSGFIIPEFGEESSKGFYLRDGGYYFAFNDYVDAKILGGIYTEGSWEASLSSSYRMRYKYNGSFSFDYSKDITGEKGSSDYSNINNYSVRWSHSQDSKFKPNSTFSASVNFASSSYGKYNGTIEDYVSAQTNSSIAYSKTWSGKPLSLSTSIQHSQNNRDSSVTLSMPNMTFNVSKIYPFRRKVLTGPERWYEKIGMTYTGTLNNTISTTQDELFTSSMFDNMKYGVNHKVPVSASFTALKYLNITPSVSYQERWYFDKKQRTWNEQTESVDIDTLSGFYRVYNYSASMSFQTILYGMYQFKGDKAIKAIRHMMTPSFSLSYAPDFSQYKYGFYEEVQSSSDGSTTKYSPFSDGIYGVPGTGQSASLSFSLSNTLEMKVRSKADTSGVKKVKLLESLNFSSSYNFLADSMKLSPISISARTTLFQTLGINASATLDPYEYSTAGTRINKYSIGRITSASLSFGYSFRSAFGHSGTGSGTGSETLPRNFTSEEQRSMLENNIDPNAAVSLLLPEYYNFSIPWNLSLNYNLSYSHSGLEKSTTQTVSYNGSITFTEKWGFSFSGGVNLETLAITPGTVSIERDLHCWQMSLSWVPVGYRKSWSFTIRAKSSVLQDLKLEKSSSYLDNYY